MHRVNKSEIQNLNDTADKDSKNSLQEVYNEVQSKMLNLTDKFSTNSKTIINDLEITLKNLDETMLLKNEKEKGEFIFDAQITDSEESLLEKIKTMEAKIEEQTKLFETKVEQIAFFDDRTPEDIQFRENTKIEIKKVADELDEAFVISLSNNIESKITYVYQYEILEIIVNTARKVLCDYSLFFQQQNRFDDNFHSIIQDFKLLTSNPKNFKELLKTNDGLKLIAEFNYDRFNNKIEIAYNEIENRIISLQNGPEYEFELNFNNFLLSMLQIIKFSFFLTLIENRSKNFKFRLTSLYSERYYVEKKIKNMKDIKQNVEKILYEKIRYREDTTFRSNKDCFNEIVKQIKTIKNLKRKIEKGYEVQINNIKSNLMK